MTTATKRYTPPGTITLQETARRLGLKYSSQIHSLRNAGDIQAFRLGRNWWVIESSVATYLKKRGQENGTAEKSE